MNGIPLINGVAYEWSDITVNIAGVSVTGITAIEYDEKQTIENHYGAGRYPVARSKGKIECSAKLTLLMQEVEVLQAAVASGRLQDIAPFDIIVSYAPENGTIVNHKIRNCQFTENARKWKQGDMKQEVELPLIVSHIEWV